MNHSKILPLSAAQVDAILAYMPLFEAPDFTAGEWVAHPGQVPYFRHSAALADFRRALSQQQILLVFDWLDWQPEAQRYLDNRTALSHASLTDLRRLFTTHVRADRFTEGHFTTVAENGHLLAMLRRLEQLRAHMHRPGTRTR